jgi:predicted 3-demethylubiquinone-9 3-methyltransferase (glyoxalase superfamily)
MQQKITPNVWFNGNAKEAADFYVAIFPGGHLRDVSYYPASAEEGLADFQTELAGKVLTVDFELGGYRFTGINAGPEFAINPSISFMLNFDPSRDDQAEVHLNELWAKLIDGGAAMMPLDTYPFSKRYGWVKDKFGVSWQLMLTNPDGEPRPFVIPQLMFTKQQAGHAEEALAYYASIFEDSRLGTTMRHAEKAGSLEAGSLMFADFRIAGQWFAAMDAGAEHDFAFNEALSLSVSCRDQAEIDELWSKLSAYPENEQCGWCKDKFGVSWQITPANMGELMQRPDAFARMMQMKKLIIADF